MNRLFRSRGVATRVLLLVALVARPAAGGYAQSTRPTPRAVIERALAPLEGVLRELQVTEAERAQVADLIARGERWAAEIVEATHHGARAVVRSRTRWIELLARTARGRVEALRAEAAAGEAERAAVAAEARRVQARAALERSVEQRIELDRGEVVSTRVLPPPEVDGGNAAADASAGPAGRPQ